MGRGFLCFNFVEFWLGLSPIRALQKGENTADTVYFTPPKTSKTDVSVHVVTDVQDKEVASVFDQKLDSSNITPNTGKYKNSSSAHVIDEYNLLNNNCTTVTVDGLNLARTKIFTTTQQIKNRTIGETYSIRTVNRPIAPVILRNYLNNKSSTGSYPVYKR